MDHSESIRLMAAEKYLLGELTPDLQEKFEEHFFECQECALDVRAGAALVEHSKVVLAEPFAVSQSGDLSPAKAIGQQPADSAMGLHQRQHAWHEYDPDFAARWRRFSSAGEHPSGQPLLFIHF